MFCGCKTWFVSDLVGNPEDRFARNTAHNYTVTHIFQLSLNSLEFNLVFLSHQLLGPGYCDQLLMNCLLVGASNIIQLLEWTKSSDVLLFSKVSKQKGLNKQLSISSL